MGKRARKKHTGGSETVVIHDNRTIIDRSAMPILCVILVLATVGIYAQSVGHGFITMDDDLYVISNSHIKAGLTWESIRWAFTSTEVWNWHPLTWISLMINYHLSGLDPSTYHAANIILHALNVVLLLLVLQQVTGSLYRSAFVAALFALHPIHVESVAWISERKDVLSTMFWLLGICAYVLYLKKPSPWRYIAILSLFAMGLMSKPMVVSFPLTLVLLDIWPLRRLAPDSLYSASLPRLFWEKVPFLVLSTISSFLTFWAQRNGAAVAPLDLLPLKFRMANAVVSYVIYLGKTIWPVNLAIFYPHPLNTLEGWEIAICLLGLAAMTLFSIAMAKRRGYITFGWLWYLITLIPVIGIIQIGRQGYADRYTYVALIGIFVIIAWGVPDLAGSFWDTDPRCRSRSRAMLGALAGVVLVALTLLANRQLRFWKDDVSAWTHAVEVTPGHALTEYGLGQALQRQRRDDEALFHYEQAVKTDPNRYEAYYNLGIIMMGRGSYAEAESALQGALRAKPDFTKAYRDLGLLLCKMKRFSESFQYYTEAIRLAPDDTETRNNLGLAHCGYGIDMVGQGNADEAIRQFEIALKLAPQSTSATAHYYLGVTYAGIGKLDLARKEYEKAILADPDFVAAHNDLGVLLAQLGKTEEAIMHFRTALAIKPDFRSAAENLRKINEARSKGR